MKQSSNSLFDLAAGLTEIIPPSILETWANSDRSREQHDKILEPHKVDGTVICSDSVGLSKMSGHYNLFEILRLIEEPKEVLNKYFNPLSGLPLGIWCADNTATFVPNNVPVKKVIEQAQAALNEIRELQVKVGLCVHYGDFYKFSDNLFGDAFELCGELAENHTSALELAVTETALRAAKLEAHAKHRSDLNFREPVYSVNRLETDLLSAPATPLTYRRAFDEEFASLLIHQNHLQLEKRLTKNHFVCLAHIAYRERHSLLLNKYLQRLNGIAKISEVEPKYRLLRIKCDGQLAIFVGTDLDECLLFAKAISLSGPALNAEVKVAVTQGDFLTFDLQGEKKEIAGSPVNIAAKLAEDSPESSGIYVHESALSENTKNSPVGKPFQYLISGVNLKGLRF